mgnify:CR=1 FL=1
MRRLVLLSVIFVSSAVCVTACGSGGDGDGDAGMNGEDAGVTPSVAVSDQTADPANEVSVDEVVSDGQGWVVIHEQNEAGDSFGAVIGQTMVSDGTNSNVTVTLDRDATDGETLYAMLHDDDPEDGNYTFDGSNGEDPPVAVDGSVVVEPFVVSVDGGDTTPSVSVSDQTADPANEVSVGEVVSDGQGWIVIHEQNEAGDSFGDVIGQTLVSDGTNSDVTVTLDRDATDGETLYAMLHDDDPEDGNYTFDGSNGEDPPVAVDGNVVVEPFVVSVDGGGTTPSVSVSDQTADPLDEVTVDEVVSDGQGWIVIHEENEAGDSFGAVIGQTLVSDGANSDVTVTLDRDITDGETLYAMLHDDDPEDGNYTFDGSNGEDPPVAVDGNVVVVPFVVNE